MIPRSLARLSWNVHGRLCCQNGVCDGHLALIWRRHNGTRARGAYRLRETLRGDGHVICVRRTPELNQPTSSMGGDLPLQEKRRKVKFSLSGDRPALALLGTRAEHELTNPQAPVSSLRGKPQYKELRLFECKAADRVAGRCEYHSKCVLCSKAGHERPRASMLRARRHYPTELGLGVEKVATDYANDLAKLENVLRGVICSEVHNNGLKKKKA